MIFPPISFGPYESIKPESIKVSDKVTLSITPIPMIGTVNIKKDYSIARSVSFGVFVNRKEENVKGLVITDHFNISDRIKQAVTLRFNNKKAPYTVFETESVDSKKIEISLSDFTPRNSPPKTVRLTFKEVYKDNKKGFTLGFLKKEVEYIKVEKLSLDYESEIWKNIYENDKKRLLNLIEKRFATPVEPMMLIINKKRYIADFIKEDVRFPFPPVSGHLFGIDSAGRDVGVRILYGLRTSLTFGLMLVLCTMTIGILAGAVQGYFGGIVDITGQRLIEIWSALPFLYIMILMGSVYGRSFILLLICYGIFNWIGISYYIRAEFLRLRKQPFAEAAKCLGLSSSRIIIKHILPNALVPVITFFPFSLVGAIGVLAALDYLGFGLPPPTPSLGELLFQAQQYRWAWWLILYPSLALFIVMLCGVFVGEGVRNAYDPKQFARID